MSNDNDSKPIPSNLEFYGKVAEVYKRQAENVQQMADILKMHAGSATNAKANEYEYKHRSKSGNKIAKQYNFMALMTGGTPITTYDNDTSGPTEGLRYFSGSGVGNDKPALEKVQKSYELMRIITGGR